MTSETLSRREAIGLTLGAATALFMSARQPASAHSAIDVVASNWKFTPSTIDVHVGEETTLHLTSSEGVHGLESSDLGIKNTMILPNKFVDVKFTAKKAGKIKLKCAVVCGEGHDTMALTINVLP